MLTIATWNINSIRARLDRFTAWLGERKPDVVCLQETKVEDKDFPFLTFEMAGYKAVHHGQKTYNGVAILSRTPLHDVSAGFADGEADEQCRVIAATVKGIRVISAYFPNGESLESPKYAYKLRWMERMRAYLDRHYDASRPLALCGDYNVAPEPRDVHAPDLWARSTLYHEQVREGLRRIAAFGLQDAYRLNVQDEGKFSWWDYRMLAFPKNHGLRIDHIFVTAPLAARCTAAVIDREARKGKLPSDHAPVIATFDWEE